VKTGLRSKTPSGEGPVARVWVRVKPRSAKTRVLGWTADGFLEVQLRAIPERGEANRACRMEIARALGVAPDRVLLEKGHTSKLKRFSIRGVTEAQVRQGIARELGDGGSP